MILGCAAHHNLLSWQVSKGTEGLRATIVPYIEAGYKDCIPLDLVEEEVIEVTVDPAPPNFFDQALKDSS